MAEGPSSPLHFAYSELVSASHELALHEGRLSGTSAAMLRLTRSLWWVTQIVGRAACGDPTSALFEEPEGGTASISFMFAQCARKTIHAFCCSPSVQHEGAAKAAAAAALLALGMLGHTPAGLRASSRWTIENRVHVFQDLCLSSEVVSQVRWRVSVDLLEPPRPRHVPLSFVSFCILLHFRNSITAQL
jgi:hypothetical protein